MYSTNFPNYNPVATIDDGSCDEGSNDIFGCTDSLYVEYNPSANQDNNSCETLVILGCTNPYSQGGLFNPLANVDDGSCILIGCSDSMYLEYYTQGFTPSIDEDTYNDLFTNEIAVFGCTDSLYLEYNFEANINNESCIIIAEYGCMDQIAFNFNSNANIDDDGSCIQIIFLMTDIIQDGLMATILDLKTASIIFLMTQLIVMKFSIKPTQ